MISLRDLSRKREKKICSTCATFATLVNLIGKECMCFGGHLLALTCLLGYHGDPFGVMHMNVSRFFLSNMVRDRTTFLIAHATNKVKYLKIYGVKKS